MIDEALNAPPMGLNPAEVAAMSDVSRRCQCFQELNSEMVRRCIQLQTPNMRQYWMRPHVKPFAVTRSEKCAAFAIARTSWAFSAHVCPGSLH